jgi:hypothetical protein
MSAGPSSQRYGRVDGSTSLVREQHHDATANAEHSLCLGSVDELDLDNSRDKGKGIDREVHPVHGGGQGPDKGISSTQASPRRPQSHDNLPLSEWCPHTIDIIRKFFTPKTAAFLFSLPRKPAALRDHSGCTKTRCTANDTQLTEGGRYNSAHWKSCAGGLECTFLGPNTQQMRDIIETGGIPLISIESDKDGALQLGVIRATLKSRFIAVSHVWSGGLGNPHHNSLPLSS